MTRLCIVISGPSSDDVRDQIHRAKLSADILEFRIDLFDFQTLEQISQLQAEANLPVIFTLRKESQGGNNRGRETLRLEFLKQLATLHPAFMDIEAEVPPSFFEELATISPITKLICSWHDWERTPDDLDTLLASMKRPKANCYKIATTAHSTVDALRMLKFVQQKTKLGCSLIGICMGEEGQSTRILGPIFGSLMTFAVLDAQKKVAPGQLTADELLNIYRLRSISSHTQIYGLIGDPISSSRSHLTHNDTMHKMDLDAVYIKMRVEAAELHPCLSLCSQLGFQGLSVTMPHKESIFPEPINTLLFTNGDMQGHNTDGSAALELLQERIPDLHNKTVVILGAGGTAQAIAQQLSQHGVALIFANRTLYKAQQLAQSYGGEAFSLDQFESIAKAEYDILINCTSVGMNAPDDSPICPSHLLQGALILDCVSSPEETCLIQAAKKRSCDIIPGTALFARQATKQFALWFGKSIEKDVYCHICEKIKHG
ncbi:MAG: type I 3-dehydroquinate dehydratase [Parachlamydiaceae bacterium]|nr:type I 3-dehydroquinate dehydratase [Parachlamydiaceae bacterium]